MLLLAAVIFGLVLVPVTRGRLSSLAAIELRGAWLLPTALAVQIVATTVVPGAPHALLAAAHIGSYVCAAVWFVRNRSVPGLWLAGAGGALNAIAIVANGGVMPASAHAMARAGVSDAARQFANSGAVAHARLLPLGDILAAPRAWPLANVFSIGDVFVAVGILVVIVLAGRASRRAPRGRRGSRPSGRGNTPQVLDLRSQPRRPSAEEGVPMPAR